MCGEGGGGGAVAFEGKREDAAGNDPRVVAGVLGGVVIHPARSGGRRLGSEARFRPKVAVMSGEKRSKGAQQLSLNGFHAFWANQLGGGDISYAGPSPGLKSVGAASPLSPADSRPCSVCLASSATISIIDQRSDSVKITFATVQPAKRRSKLLL